MLHFSRKTDLALLILSALARTPTAFVSVRALARTHRLPYRFAAEVVSELSRGGLLTSREGARGGYRLARTPREMTVADVVRVTEHGPTLVGCLAGDHARCPQQAWCTAKDGMALLQQNLQASLARMTVADFLRAKKGIPVS